jgi:hypothetical protein
MTESTAANTARLMTVTEAIVNELDLKNKLIVRKPRQRNSTKRVGSSRNTPPISSRSLGS